MSNMSNLAQLLKDAMDTLKKDIRLQRELDARPTPDNRDVTSNSHIWKAVWDVVTIGDRKTGEDFRKKPHLDLVIGEKDERAMLTISNQIDQAILTRLASTSISDLTNACLKFHQCTPAGAKPYISVSQRHWATRSGPPTEDALLSFDPVTAIPPPNASLVKPQPQWLHLVKDLAGSKSSNLEFQFGFRIESKDLGDSRVIDCELISKCWLACRPFAEIFIDIPN